MLFVDTRPLHALLLQNRAELEQAVKSDPRSEKTPQQREQLELFVKLASRSTRSSSRSRAAASGCPRAAPSTRSSASPTSRASSRDDKHAPTAEFNSGRSFANTMDLAVFGRTRTEPDNAWTKSRAGASPRSRRPGGPWEMKDMSVSGFRLHAPMSVATEVTLSMLVAIRRRGEDAWVLGIVRRMRRLSADNAEIGLQLIANALASAELVEQRKARDGDYSVDGDPAAAVRPPVPRPLPVVQPARRASRRCSR